MNDNELMRARVLATEVERRTGKRFRPTVIGKLARRGKLPVAGRDRSGALLFSSRAIAALAARETGPARRLETETTIRVQRIVVGNLTKVRNMDSVAEQRFTSNVVIHPTAHPAAKFKSAMSARGRHLRPHGGTPHKWRGQCPCAAAHTHGDRRASLSVTWDDCTGRLLVHCFAGCRYSDILAALGLTGPDLFLHRRFRRPIVRIPVATRTFDYTEDEQGVTIRARKVRIDYDADGRRSKEFRWEHERNGEWRPGLNGVRVGLFNIAAVRGASVVFGCEGEGNAVAVTKGVATDKAGHVGVNRLKARLRHLFNWLIEHDYLKATPFRENGATRVKLNRDAERERDRRLVGDEEARLLKHASPHMQTLIVAALETGCRLGELLGLVWRDVNLSKTDGAIYLRAATTKTGKARAIPITQRLRAVLDMRRNGPDGEPLPLTAHVFGNEVGEPVARIKTAWLAACRRAGIHALHFHDLRREFASRLLESPNVNTANVRDWLGHANITTTSRYLKTTIAGLKDVAKNFEAVARRRIAHGLHKPAEHAAVLTTASPAEVSQVQ
jgi:integrase